MSLTLNNHANIGRIEKIVGAKEFLKIVQNTPSRIVSSKAIPPSLGSNNLTVKFKVTYR